MNAIELADRLDLINEQQNLQIRAATMLRQQQDLLDGADVVIKELQERLEKKMAEIEALKAKTLTDEEIIELFEHPDDFNCIDFARAILRKAQENPLQDKLDAIANKVVFGKAQEG